MTETTQITQITQTPVRAWLRQIKRHPSAVLLFAQLGGLLLYPFVEQTRSGRAMLAAFGVLVLILAIQMVSRTPGRVWISITLAVPAAILSALYWMFDMQSLVLWQATLEALFYFYAAGCLIAYMMDDRRATLDELFAAGATFTLLAWAFTYVFLICQVLQPGAFGAAVNTEAARTWTELAFLSFALLSSTGIGDVIPLTVQARAVASLEMFVGVMYLALVVSRLVALTVSPRNADN